MIREMGPRIALVTGKMRALGGAPPNAWAMKALGRCNTCAARTLPGFEAGATKTNATTTTLTANPLFPLSMT